MKRSLRNTYSLDDARIARKKEKHSGLKGATYKLSLKGSGPQRQEGIYLILEDRNDEIDIVRIDRGKGISSTTVEAKNVRFICPIAMARVQDFPGLKGARLLLQALQS